MEESILSVLELAKPSFPLSLIDEEGYARLAVVADQLPEELTTFWGFECRLGEPEAKADILFETSKQSRGQRLLAGHTPSSLDVFCRQWTAWQTLREFARLWADPAHPFSNQIRNIWLEFDTAASPSTAQSAALIQHPNIFFGPDAESLAKDQFCRLILDALAALGQHDGGHSRLESFFTSLPDGARLFQVGLMLSRKNSGLRVCVSKLVPEAIPAWLSNLGWTGNTGALTGLVQTIASVTQTMTVGLNLTEEGPAEKIGVECYMDWNEDDPGQWIPLLDFVENLNLCLPQKRQGLLDFPGVTPSPQRQRVEGSEVVNLNLFRKIHHIKLNVSAGRVVEAKAYLALSRPVFHLDQSFAESRDAWLIE